MARTFLQVVGWLFCMIGFGASIGVLLSHKWKSSTMEGIHHSVLDSVQNVEGLLEYCQVYPSGQVQCWPFSGPLYEQPPIIATCRALLVLAILLGGFTGFVSFFGFRCTQIGPSDRRSQDRVALICGIFLFLSGASATASACIYIYNVINSPPTFDPRGNIQRYSLEEAVKICLASGLLWLLGSTVYLLGLRVGNSNDVHYDGNLSQPTQEYI